MDIESIRSDSGSGVSLPSPHLTDPADEAACPPDDGVSLPPDSDPQSGSESGPPVSLPTETDAGLTLSFVGSPRLSLPSSCSGDDDDGVLVGCDNDDGCVSLPSDDEDLDADPAACAIRMAIVSRTAISGESIDCVCQKKCLSRLSDADREFPQQWE